MRGKFAYSVIAMGLVLSSHPCSAEEGSHVSASDGVENVHVSTTSADVTSKALLDHFYLNYFAIYHGAPLSDLGSSHSLDNHGNLAKSAIYLDSEITGAYMVDSNIGIGPTIPFLLVPVLGQGIILGDVGLKMFDKKTVSTKGFDLYTNLILQGPSSKSSQARNMTFAVKTTPSLRYSFPGSRFTIGAWTEAKAYLGVSTDKTFKLYGAPYINYRVAPKLSLNLEYEFEAHHDVGHSTFDFSAYQSDIEPGIIWNITPKILFNPYIQFFTGNKITMDNTSIGAVISATVL